MFHRTKCNRNLTVVLTTAELDSETVESTKLQSVCPCLFCVIACEYKLRLHFHSQHMKSIL